MKGAILLLTLITLSLSVKIQKNKQINIDFGALGGINIDWEANFGAGISGGFGAEVQGEGSAGVGLREGEMYADPAFISAIVLDPTKIYNCLQCGQNEKFSLAYYTVWPYYYDTSKIVANQEYNYISLVSVGGYETTTIPITCTMNPPKACEPTNMLIPGTEFYQCQDATTQSSLDCYIAEVPCIDAIYTFDVRPEGHAEQFSADFGQDYFYTYKPYNIQADSLYVYDRDDVKSDFPVDWIIHLGRTATPFTDHEVIVESTWHEGRLYCEFTENLDDYMTCHVTEQSLERANFNKNNMVEYSLMKMKDVCGRQYVDTGINLVLNSAGYLRYSTFIFAAFCLIFL